MLHAFIPYSCPLCVDVQAAWASFTSYMHEASNDTKLRAVLKNFILKQKQPFTAVMQISLYYPAPIVKSCREFVGAVLLSMSYNSYAPWKSASWRLRPWTKSPASDFILVSGGGESVDTSAPRDSVI